MSDREKKLLSFFAVAGFIILNFLAYRYAQTMRVDVDRQRAEAERKLDTAQMFSASRDQVLDQMEWLKKNEPAPAPNQDVQTKLQQFAESRAKAVGLEIKNQKALPSDETGDHYHRAKFQFTVTGTEEALYRWFDQLNVPTDFRRATYVRLSPNGKDDTKIDCVATVEQWFVPPTT